MTKKQYRAWKKEQEKNLILLKGQVLTLLDEARKVHGCRWMDPYTKSLEDTASAVQAVRDTLATGKQHLEVRTFDPESHERTLSNIGNALAAAVHDGKLKKLRARRQQVGK